MLANPIQFKLEKQKIFFYVKIFIYIVNYEIMGK